MFMVIMMQLQDLTHSRDSFSAMMPHVRYEQVLYVNICEVPGSAVHRCRVYLVGPPKFAFKHVNDNRCCTASVHHP